MDDLYSFGKTKYVRADPIQRSIFRIVANVLLVSYTLLKCTVLGILLALKSLLFVILPKFPKDVQYQVALVWIFKYNSLKYVSIMSRFFG